MSAIDFLIAKFEAAAAEPAFVWQERAVTYRALLDALEAARGQLREAGVGAGDVVLLSATFSPAAVAMLLALFEAGAITGVADSDEPQTLEQKIAILDPAAVVRIDAEGGARFEPRLAAAAAPLIATLRQSAAPGLVLFSSGTAGAIKAAVHDVARLLAKYRRARHNLRTLAFLRFSHIGGIDTLLYSLANGSCLVMSDDRSPEGVCRAIERHRVQVLPAAPSFLNLMALDGAWQRHDLSSLRFVTYGAEVMAQATLDRCVEMFPGVALLQKYGTTEVGTLRSKSKAPGSRWVRLGGEGYQLRVVDGLLQIKAASAMLGYLNAPSPIDADGWFHTGDLAEVDGDYLLINGRVSDVINVGGRKVYPAEVESALLRVENVADATVYGEPNAFLGQIVCARVQTAHDEPLEALRRRIHERCGQVLDPYKVPSKIVFGSGADASDRFKKVRRAM